MSSNYGIKVKDNKELDAYIGAKIKFRRSMLNISQHKLGDLLGVTFQQIQKYEKGSNRVSASTLYIIASILEVDISYFVNGFDGIKRLHDDNSAVYNSDISNKKESIDLLREYYKFNEGVRKKFLDFMKYLAATM